MSDAAQQTILQPAEDAAALPPRRNWHFWAFNVADSAITIGVAIMILDMLGVDKRRRA